jgi:putative ABC transport system permease protein
MSERDAQRHPHRVGADVRRLPMLVLRQGLVSVVLGTLAGLATALAASRLLEPFLFEVAPFDPATYGGVALLVAVVAAIACYAPGRRATRLDPMSVLKSE